MIIVGIDYSMSSPAICIHTGDAWSFDNCQFHFLTDKKKFSGSKAPFIASLHESYTTQEERFDNISNWAISLLPKASRVFLEGYAFGAKGVVFQIGENTGILKHKLWKSVKAPITILAPSVIKKEATGKGNANKELMHVAFIKETGYDLQGHFLSKVGESPMSDVIDAYYIAKCGFKILNKIK